MMEEKNKRMQRAIMGGGCLALLISLGIAAAIVLLSVSMVGCKAQEKVITKTEVVTAIDTVYQTKWQHDSITLHDSVYIHQKGDTVWSERWHTAYKWRTRIDTSYIYKEVPHIVTDTIYQVKEVPVEKIKYKQHWWQSLLSWLGGILGISGLAYLLIRIKF